MLFNSLSFFLFFPITTIGYFILPQKYQWIWLLLASCVFYMAFIPVYILILFLLILIDYLAGIYIEKSTGAKRKIFLSLSIISNVGILGFFKYFNFFNENLLGLAQFFHWNYSLHSLSIILPIGLSFHTFQAMSYTIEVYRGNQKAERHLGIYALYVMFYPQLVAGPIERPQNLIHQFYEKHEFNCQRTSSGLRLMLWGLFKKVVIADQLAVFVNLVYSSPSDYHGLVLIMATIFFSFQIFCDFSGYSDIAIGAAQIMGFTLMKNFDRPYFAKSISEFWKRWHISLSTWFKDYLYISLGGNRVSMPRWYINILIVFLVSGFWHGANWTFLVWGALHGTYLLVSMWFQNIRTKILRWLHLYRMPFVLKCIQVLTTFSLVSFAWIFFRASSLADATYIITHLFSGPWTVATPYGLSAQFSGLLHDLHSVIYLLAAIFAVVFMEVVHYNQKNRTIEQFFFTQKVWLRWTTYYSLLCYILLFGRFDASKFIYFQF